jgi:N-dimethylarginine dimethylaminohydrolase
MIAPLKRVIMKRPEEAFRDLSNWKELGFLARPDYERAVEEHAQLVKALEEQGVLVLFLPEDDRTTADSIYAHDPVLITDSGAILLKPGKPVRRGEVSAMADALRAWHVPVLGVMHGEATAEGGDLLWLDEKTLIVGRSFRTNEAGCQQLARMLEPTGVRVVEVHLPCGQGRDEVLHLMSVISLVDRDLATIYEQMLPVPLFELLQERGFALIRVPEAEYPTLGCNVVATAPRNVIVFSGNPVTRGRMEEAGCRVTEIRGMEIGLKGNGGPTCLTRPLLRG